MEAVPIVLLKGNRTIVMNAEGSESLPLHYNKLACPSFMAAGRRHEIPGDERLYYSWHSRQHELHNQISFP